MLPTLIEEVLNDYLKIVLTKSTTLIVSVYRTYQHSEYEIYQAQKEMLQRNINIMDKMLTQEYKASYQSREMTYEDNIEIYFKMIKKDICSHLNYAYYHEVQIPEDHKRPIQWDIEMINHTLSFQSETTYGPLVDRYSYTLNDAIKTSLQEACTFADLKRIIGESIRLEVLSFYDSSNKVTGVINVEEKYIEPIAEFQDKQYFDYGY